MSLIGNNHAFIGCGVSCQTAHQIIAHREQLSVAVADQLFEQSSFLNWVYLSSDEIPRLVERLLAGPIEEKSIHVPTASHAALMLEDFKVWLWHEKPSHVVTTDDVAIIASKYEHLRKNFAHMFTKKVQYLVVSNTQNNLIEHYPFQTGRMDIFLNRTKVDAVINSSWAKNPYGELKVLFVSDNSRWTGPAHPDVTLIDRDVSEWQGDGDAWLSALNRKLGLRAKMRTWLHRASLKAA